MKKSIISLLAITTGFATSMGISLAEDASIDKQEIVAACTEEAKGAIDVQEYIDECVKEKVEEMKEMAKEAEPAKEKS